jgi:hypothetical protein
MEGRTRDPEGGTDMITLFALVLELVAGKIAGNHNQTRLG